MDALDIISLLCIAGTLGLLVTLSIIDMKHRLLPNELVLGVLCFGVVFHLCTLFEQFSAMDMMIGGLIGAGSLYMIRFIANRHYKTDTLGLGDVKLMGAAGIWLGPYFILIALTLGALTGLAHGIGYALIIAARTKRLPNFATLSLPAGPGFAVGIVIAGALMLQNLPKVLFG